MLRVLMRWSGVDLMCATSRDRMDDIECKKRGVRIWRADKEERDVGDERIMAYLEDMSASVPLPRSPGRDGRAFSYDYLSKKARPFP